MERNADTHIRIQEQTWTELNAEKRPGDSFDDVIRRFLDLLDGHNSIDDLEKSIEKVEMIEELDSIEKSDGSYHEEILELIGGYEE